MFALQTWLDCRVQFVETFVHGWRPRGKPLPLHFGGVMHKLTENFRGSRRPPKDVQLRHFLKQQDQEWLRTDKRTIKQREERVAISGQAFAAFSGYVRRYKGEFGGAYPKGWKPKILPGKWLKPEQEIVVKWNPLYDCPSEPVKITGFIDQPFIDSKGHHWVMDMKNQSRFDAGVLMPSMEYDLQVNLYMWAYWKMTGVMPRGFLIDGVVRPNCKPGKTQTIAELVRATRTKYWISDNWKELFQRFPLPVSKTHVIDWEGNTLRPMLDDFWSWWTGQTPHYMNAKALMSRYGKCQTFDIITSGNTSEHRKANYEKAKTYKRVSASD